jgi:acetoin utilization deacetylase AcuC-like enzyme
MITFYNPSHRGHAPAHEFFRGERVPCFESPARVDYVEEALRARGHTMEAPDVDSSPVLSQIHAPRYLAFLQTAWQQWLALNPANGDVQPFPSVWPVRTLRSDLEPENFVARLGLYSMDNGTPLAHGTWGAAKAGPMRRPVRPRAWPVEPGRPSAAPGRRATMPGRTSWAATAS